MRYVGTATAIAAALALTGCGGNKADDGNATQAAGAEEASTAGDTNLDVCGLISTGEVSTITGDKVAKAEKTDDGCTYQTGSDDGVQLVAMKTGGKDKMDIARKTANVLGGMGAAVADKGGAGADVAGMLKKDDNAPPALGDEAMWGANSTLSVRKGDAYLEVTPPIMHDPSSYPGNPLMSKQAKREIAVKVATAVLAKL